MPRAADPLRCFVWSVVVLTGVSVATGCQDAPAVAVFTTTDSSGVFIATTAGDHDVGHGSIAVEGPPLFTIGTVAGDSVYQFSRIRGGVRLADGGVAVVDATSRQVRVFDNSGVFVRSWGRRGGGPGEFQRPWLAGRIADTLVVFDVDNRRIARIHATDGLASEASIGEEAGGFFQVQGLFGDGTVVSGGGFFFRPGQEGLTTGLRRPPTGFVRIGDEGEVITDFGQFPGLEMFFEVTGDAVSARLVPFGPITDGGVADDRLYVGTGDTPEVQVFGREGRLVGIIRWEPEIVSVTADDVAGYVEESLADADDEDEKRRIRSLARDHAREFFPPYQNLETDRLGNLWVSEYQRPGDDVAAYRVFDPEGRMIARVVLPPRVTPLEIGEDYLVARRLDELDIEYVELYRLTR